jgi:hypothetical protein
VRPPRFASTVLHFLARHDRLLWSLHSLWALALGFLVMWAGARNYAWLRLTIFYLAFLWLASLVVPSLVDRPDSGTRWKGRLRLVINYFTKNFYQQLLFFLLPIYYQSATGWSLNLAFVGVLGVSALISTLDVFYDQHLSVRRGLTAVFFAFNLFACINVMLPVVFGISNGTALRASVILAVVAFATIRFRLGELARFHVRLHVGLAAIVLLLLVSLGRPLIPPAPLRIVSSEFGAGINRLTFEVTSRIDQIPSDWSGRLYGVTAIYAPLGLRDRVGHRWYQEGRLIYASAFYHLEGGRPEGFRLWTSAPLPGVPSGTRVRIDVVTEAGQLIGRAEVVSLSGSASSR